MRSFIMIFVSCIFCVSCSIERRISKSAHRELLNDSTLSAAHTGISIFDAGAGKYLYNYQGDKYFVPASNTKIFTCYAAMKYLGDSLPAMSYVENDTAIFIQPGGDPSFLHPDYKKQPVADFLRNSAKPVYITDANWKDKALGSGWAWNDYSEYYMAERSALPVYGNVIRWVQEKTGESPNEATEFDQTVSIYSIPEVNWEVRFNPAINSKNFDVERSKDENSFLISQGSEKRGEIDVPFVTNGIQSALELLSETFDKDIRLNNLFKIPDSGSNIIFSQPTDSLLRPMMYRSDNFFAEQVLLMVSNKLLGEMNDASIIDSLLKTDLSNLPQKPRWADGSGLSRYNLFTPQSFVAILEKMKEQIGMDRIKTVFPTGGTGTLGDYYRDEQGAIYAKTGTLSGVVALSGYLYTKKNKLLIFSVLVNNHRGNSIEIRRKVESFLIGLRQKY